MTTDVITFEVKIVYMFNLSNPEPGRYKCYAVVEKPERSKNPEMITGETIVMSGMSDMDLAKGDKLLVTGEFQGLDHWKGDTKKIFKISHVHPASDFKSLVKYFKSKRFNGIGEKKAYSIVMRLGVDCIDKIQKDPKCLDKVPGLTDDMKRDIITHVVSSDIDIFVRKVVPGVSDKFLDYMNDFHRPDGMMILQTDPYILLEERHLCQAIKFDLIDAIGRGLGIGLTSIHRIRYVVRSVAKDLLERGDYTCSTVGGSVLINLSDASVRSKFMNGIISKLEIPWNIIEKAIMSGDAGVKLLTCYGPGGSQVIGCYLSEMLTAEARVGEILRSAVESKSILNGVSQKEITQAILDYGNTICAGMPLTAEQMIAIQRAMTNRVSVLTGGPGSGKTTVICGIIYAWQRLCDKAHLNTAEASGAVLLAGPTGMAVRRMNEAVEPVKPDDADNDLSSTFDSVDADWKSGTIAKYTVSVKNKSVDKDSIRRAYNHGKYRLVIIDETSMVSLEDFAMFLDLMPQAQFVFVGDTDQLPSIAPGEIMADLCTCGVIPVTTLTINHRSKSAMAIAENSQKIHDGDYNLATDPGIFDISYFNMEDQAMLDFAVNIYFDELQALNQDLSELAMIAPMNRRGMCCVSHLNSILREKLNPITNTAANTTTIGNDLYIRDVGHEVMGLTHYDSIDKKTYKLRIGDRVVITKNNCAMGDSVVNGDRGFIEEFRHRNRGSRDENFIVVIKLDDGRKVRLEDKSFKYVELAYATTVHKSQGCEYRSVIFIAQGGIFFGDFANRNLIYTACTRAKRHCHVIGLQKSVEHCITHPRLRRMSMLGYRLAGKM